MITRSCVVASVAGLFLGAACGSNPTSPTQPRLPATSDSSHFVYHHAPEDIVDISWEQNYYTWLVGRLG